MTTPDHSGKQRFLSTLPPTIRGACFNLFLYPARKGVTDPADIVIEVLHTLERRLRTSEGDSLENARLMVAAVRDDLEGAEECARAAIAHDARPLEERLAEKEHGKREGVNRWMQGQLPTEKQVKYLNFLGYKGPIPSSMAAAGELIESHQKGHAR